uniref:helix-turn-helix domain-containing protein n=1 Tax=Ndongobacter massiliensis TaxID=1871025 RepID=UPI0009310842|nr:helix-turn-helix transcriptional regulator [Ndongobacter massiliensis]
MGFPEEIKRIRQRCFLTQKDFAKEIQVAFSTVNRWEGGKAKPNLIAMKNIKEFCLKNDVGYTGVEEAWLDFKVEGKSK